MHVDLQRLCNDRLDLDDEMMKRKNDQVKYKGDGKSSFLSMHMITEFGPTKPLQC